VLEQGGEVVREWMIMVLPDAQSNTCLGAVLVHGDDPREEPGGDVVSGEDMDIPAVKVHVCDLRAYPLEEFDWFWKLKRGLYDGMRPICTDEDLAVCYAGLVLSLQGDLYNVILAFRRDDLVIKEDVRASCMCVCCERLIESFSIDDKRVHVITADGEGGVRWCVDVGAVDLVLDKGG